MKHIKKFNESKIDYKSISDFFAEFIDNVPQLMTSWTTDMDY